MFGRGEKPSLIQRIRRAVYPDGGWWRAIQYLVHRVRRINDSPRSIAKGVFIGTWVAFTPLFGLHFLIAPLGAWACGGNILASILAVLVCNPLTFTAIAAGSVSIGGILLGTGMPSFGARALGSMFEANAEMLWSNLGALFSPREANWEPLVVFFHEIFLPYLAGGLVLGALFGAAAGLLSARLISAYQSRRAERRRKRGALRRSLAGLKRPGPQAGGT